MSREQFAECFPELDPVEAAIDEAAAWDWYCELVDEFDLSGEGGDA